MALIVHKREDGSLALDPRSDFPDSHALPAAALVRWGVKPGHDVTLVTSDGEAVYQFSAYGTKIVKGEEVTDYKVLVYEKVTDNG